VVEPVAFAVSGESIELSDTKKPGRLGTFPGLNLVPRQESINHLKAFAVKGFKHFGF
jgi:hypothetical protein